MKLTSISFNLPLDSVRKDIDTYMDVFRDIALKSSIVANERTIGYSPASGLDEPMVVLQRLFMEFLGLSWYDAHKPSANVGERIVIMDSLNGDLLKVIARWVSPVALHQIGEILVHTPCQRQLINTICTILATIRVSEPPLHSTLALLLPIAMLDDEFDEDELGKLAHVLRVRYAHLPAPKHKTINGMVHDPSNIVSFISLSVNSFANQHPSDLGTLSMKTRLLLEYAVAAYSKGGIIFK